MQIHSRKLYSTIHVFQDYEVKIETRYKTMERKIKPIAIPLPNDSKSNMLEKKRV